MLLIQTIRNFIISSMSLYKKKKTRAFIETSFPSKYFVALITRKYKPLNLCYIDVWSGNVRYIWTSGRKCNFNGCDRADLQPQNINGWFWSGSGAKIGPTTQRNSGDWSNTGGYGQPQPDNREAAQVRHFFHFFFFIFYSYICI